MNDLVREKFKLRKILTKKRDIIKKESVKSFNYKIFNILRKKIDFEKIYNIASFISIKSEIETKELNNHILNLEKNLLLPCIKKNKDFLVFKKYEKNFKLRMGKFNIPEPNHLSDEIKPELFFVPCLGFDLNGYRIGYGGGYYDKTLSKLVSENHKFYSVGYAFDDQKQVKIPIEKFDHKLDFVLTEKELYTFI